MISNVFWNANTHLSEIFYFNIFEYSGKHIQSITSVKQIFQFCLHAIFLLAVVFKRASLCNREHLDLQIFYRFQSNLCKKLSHAVLICFHYFCILLVQSKHNNIKIALCSEML